MVAGTALLRVNITHRTARSTKKESRKKPVPLTTRTPARPRGVALARPAYRQRAARRGRRAPSATGPQDRRRGVGAGAVSGAVGASRCRVTVDRGGLQGFSLRSSCGLTGCRVLVRVSVRAQRLRVWLCEAQKNSRTPAAASQ